MRDKQRKAPENRAVRGGIQWWAWQGLNLRPLRCQHSAIPGKAQKTRKSRFSIIGTVREQIPIRGPFYRRFTARISVAPAMLGGA